MKALGLSQAELARRVGVSQPSIFKLIHENKTGSTRIHVIARVLKTTPAYLTGETDDPQSDVPEETLTPEEREWVEQLRKIPARDRSVALRMLRGIASAKEQQRRRSAT